MSLSIVEGKHLFDDLVRSLRYIKGDCRVSDVSLHFKLEENHITEFGYTFNSAGIPFKLSQTGVKKNEGVALVESGWSLAVKNYTLNKKFYVLEDSLEYAINLIEG